MSDCCRSPSAPLLPPLSFAGTVWLSAASCSADPWPLLNRYYTAKSNKLASSADCGVPPTTVAAPRN